MYLPFISPYGLFGSIGTHVPVAPGIIGFHDITLTVPVARFILTPDAATLWSTFVVTLPTDISISEPPGNILAEALTPTVPVLTFALFPVKETKLFFANRYVD